uniref:Clc-like protein n=1 Tax=Parascaris univalens TaxID=6257 RepID=A0A915C1P8_PARUN
MMSGNSKSNLSQTIVLVVALVLLFISIALCAAGLLSPSWQVVDIREFRAVHHHGLWQDCTRANRHFISHTDSERAESTALSCTYKFDYSASEVIDENLHDIDENSAAGEAEHHQFFGWHKAVLICIFLSLIVAGLAVSSGICAPCHSMCAVLFAILIFIALFFSIVAVGIFFFAAHRVDSRFVQGLVGTYEQEIGSAFFLYGSGTILMLFSFIVATVATYQLLQKSEGRSEIPMRELAPLYNSRMRDTVI